MQIINSRFGRVAQRGEYAVLLAYFAFLWLTTDAGPATATHIGNIVFAEFLGHFITIIIAVHFGRQLGIAGRLLLLVLVGGFGLFLLLDFTENPLAAGVWMVSIAISLLNNYHETLMDALIQGVWLMIAGFSVAFFGSMAGIDPDALLATDINTVAAWGITYYIGLLLMPWVVDAETLHVQ